MQSGWDIRPEERLINGPLTTSEAGMSEAQKKAASIKASLANPFEMVRYEFR